MPDSHARHPGPVSRLNGLGQPDWTCHLQRFAGQELVCHQQESHYGLLWIEGLSRGELELDFVQFQLQPGQVLFWAPGQVCKLTLKDFAGWRLSFGLDSFCLSGLNDTLLESLGLFAPLAGSPLLTLPAAERAELDWVWAAWEQEQASQAAYQRQLIATYLRLMLLRCGRLARQTAVRPTPAQGESEIWSRFRSLLEMHFRQWHQVSDYAQALAVTPDHLNQVVKQASQRSAKQLIQERLMLEARRAAWFSQDSLKQIAYDLGFDDPAYFSRLFRRCSGQPFSDFRNQIQTRSDF